MMCDLLIVKDVCIGGERQVVKMIKSLLPNVPIIIAYIDAGTATVIVQFIIAGAAAGFIFIKGWWKHVKKIISWLFKRKVE